MYIQFAELPVRDQERAKTFYVKHLSCEVAADAPMGSGTWRWIELKLPGSQTNLHFVRAKTEDTSSEPALVLVDSNVINKIETLRASGVEIITEPHKPAWQPGRTVAAFRDSEGNTMVIGTP